MSPTEAATKVKSRGYKWVAYQLNDENLGSQQRQNCFAFKAAMKAQGIIFTCWMTRHFTPQLVRQYVTEFEPDGIILEAEVPSEWWNPATGDVEPKPEAVDWVDVIFHLADIDIPKAVVSNFAPFVHADDKDTEPIESLPWPEKAKPLVDDGWAYISECFITESPNATPANTDWYAKTKLGWPRTQPMIEAWHVADYGDLSGFQNVSHWDLGNVA
jgi:hypothetical protein